MQLKEKNIKFETLKKSHKKQIVIGALVVCLVGGALTFATTRAKYRVTYRIPLVRSKVNYTPYDFKVMAMYQQKEGMDCTDDSCYDVITDRMPASGYVINEEKSYCTLDNKTHDTEAKIYTDDRGKHIFENFKKSEKCYVWFDKELSPSEKVLASLNIAKVNTTTPIFTNTATTDEGIFKVEDGMYGGYSYYWRGAVENNHVKFAGYCWRIIRINGDGSIRLIYDGTTCHANGTSTADSIAVTSQKYNTSYNQSNYVGWTYSGTSQRPANNATGTASNIKTQTENWFTSHIVGTNVEKVADGKFCNNRDVASGYTWAINGSPFNYKEYENMNNGTPSLSCPSGDEYTLKAGAITASEVMFAGGGNSNNTSYYLYNGQSYWTISPNLWGTNIGPFVFHMGTNGVLNGNYITDSYGVRPVINLKPENLKITGNGLINDPYVIAN